MILRNKQATMSQVMEQFLPLYRQSNHLSPEQASACQSIIQCQTDILGGMFLTATNVTINSAIIKVVAIATAQSANKKQVLSGRINNWKAIFQSRITIWSLLCPIN